MSAAISEVTIDGRNIVEAMYANRPAWHNLGTVLDLNGGAPDSATAMETAHLGWLAEKQQLYLGDGSAAQDCFAMVRNDTGAVLGAVGARYQPLQNAEAFAFMDSLNADGIIRYECAFALHGGAQVVLLARLPSVDHFADGDSGLRYILMRTSHDGTSGIDMLPTSMRVECANMTAIAIAEGKSAGRCLSIRHTGDLNAKLSQARRYLSLFDEQFTLYADSAKRLAECRYTPEQAVAFINAVFPIDTDKTDRQNKMRERKIAAVRNAFRHRSNQLPAIAGSAWQLVNAVTYAADHDELFNRAKGDSRNRAESRFLRAAEGDGAELKRSALAIATAMFI